MPMNDELRTLLTKTRKDATASFGAKQWAMVLEALGFTVELNKERRTVVGAVITAPNGKTLNITKEPRYRHITFYEVPRWMKAQGYDLVQLTSEKLGLNTPSEEARLKDLYVRDLRNTGTCPVCEGNFKRDTKGGLVHHGYQRPGDGYIVGDCFAVAYQPWELSPQGAKDYLAKALRPALKREQEWLARLQRDEVSEFRKEVRDWSGGTRAKKTVIITREQEYEFQDARRSAIYAAEHQLKSLARDVARFETKIAAWKEDVLPEIKHAGKFKIDA